LADLPEVPRDPVDLRADAPEAPRDPVDLRADAPEAPRDPVDLRADAAEGRLAPDDPLAEPLDPEDLLALGDRLAAAEPLAPEDLLVPEDLRARVALFGVEPAVRLPLARDVAAALGEPPPPLLDLVPVVF
jgi:hypothetical protein